jgi:NAD(P)-dependent dehydrogenase (short-subunit alcohol dehydrogenase family)
VLPQDITEPAAAAAIIGATLDRFGRLDALVNVAGFASQTPIEQITADEWRATIDTNLSAVVMLTAAAWPALRASASGGDSERAFGGGVIVNVSSMASIDPFPQFAMYAAAKAGVNLFTRCTASEGAEWGIRAVAVAPGAVETPMLRSMFDERVIPREKALAPEDVAKVICGCVTGKRGFEAGEVIVVGSP